MDLLPTEIRETSSRILCEAEYFLIISRLSVLPNIRNSFTSEWQWTPHVLNSYKLILLLYWFSFWPPTLLYHYIFQQISWSLDVLMLSWSPSDINLSVVHCSLYFQFHIWVLEYLHLQYSLSAYLPSTSLQCLYLVISRKEPHTDVKSSPHCEHLRKSQDGDSIK